MDLLKVQAKNAKTQEKEAVKERAKIYLDRNDILTEYEIRRRSIAGNMDGLSHLAYEKLNKACQAVGWDGERKEDEPIELSSEQREHVQALLLTGLIHSPFVFYTITHHVVMYHKSIRKAEPGWSVITMKCRFLQIS